MSRPLRVLQILTRRQLRGAEVFAAGLSEGLLRRGLEVEIAALFPPGEPPLDTGGVPSQDLFPRRPRGVHPRLVGQVRRILDSRRPDLVQANGSSTLKYSVLARLVAHHRCPLVYRNISIASHWLRGPLHRWWNRRLLHAADHVVAVSQHSARDLVDVFGLPPEGITVLPRGVRVAGSGIPEPRQALAHAVGCDPRRPILAHVGSFTPEKNHAGLLRVLAAVRRRHAGAQLVLFGDGPLRDEVERRAEATGLATDVHFAGARDDAADLAAGADAMVLFSFIEGMPGVVLEAGARGLPVVATEAGGVAEVIENGESGLLVPVGDEEACAEAIHSLLDSPELARRLATALKERVRSGYDLEILVDRYAALYRRLVRSGAGESG